MKIYYTDQGDLYQCKQWLRWYDIQHHTSINKEEVVIKPTEELRREDLAQKNCDKLLEHLCYISNHEPVKIFATDLGVQDPFDCENKGFEVCGFRLTNMPDSTICKQYRLFDNFKFATYEVYATDNGIEYAEMKIENTHPEDKIGLNISLPETMAMSQQEADLFKMINQIAQSMLAGDVVITGKLTS